MLVDKKIRISKPNALPLKMELVSFIWIVTLVFELWKTPLPSAIMELNLPPHLDLQEFQKLKTRVQSHYQMCPTHHVFHTLNQKRDLLPSFYNIKLKRNPRSIVYGCHSIYIHRLKNNNNIDIFVSRLQQHIIHWFNHTPTWRITPMFFGLTLSMMNSTLKLSKSARALLLDNKWKKRQNFGQMLFFGFGGLGSKPF
jgi:hypothetical protein